MASLKILSDVFGSTIPYFEILQYFVEEYKKHFMKETSQVAVLEDDAVIILDD